jgi:hypothetical protein
MPYPDPNKIAQLRKIMAKASARGKKLPRKAGRPRLGTRGTNFAEAKMSMIKKIAETRGINSHEATQVLSIFLEAHKGNISPPAADHQVLVNIANGVLKAEKLKQEVKLNPNQKALLEKYYRMSQ